MPALSPSCFCVSPAAILAARIYGLSPAYIRRLCKTGKIRYVNAGHMWLVNLDSLARYFEQGDPVDGSQTAEGIRRVAR